MPAVADIKQLAARHNGLVLAVRRHLHQYPELSFNEVETARFICTQLDKLNIPYTAGHVKTGVVALVKGKNPEKKTILLRADMDALPITEKNNTEYISRHPGVMHACGHDVHSACALGAAAILNETKENWEGTVKIIFQPGEEVLPGGASLMIKEGVLKKPNVSKAIAQHVHPAMEAGKVGFRSGMYMSSTDEIYLTIIGKGGHAAMPADYNNPLLIAAEILLELKKNIPDVPAQAGDAKAPTVLAFGKMEAKGATNVIPDSVSIAGTFRTMDEAWRKEVHQRMTNIITEICSRHHAKAEVRIEKGYPFLVNDTALTEQCRKAAEEYLGKENV
ncbi:MAG: M20 metallopeptidase family protein, partial [Bacteroidia bacterium]